MLLMLVVVVVVVAVILLLLLAVASGWGSTTTTPVVMELSFLLMCPHVALKSNAGCTDSTTHGTREFDGGRCR